MNQVLFSHAEKFEEKVAFFQHAGFENLCVVSDWDRTMTYPHTHDGKPTTSYLVIVHGNYLGEPYRVEMERLYQRYRWVEVDTALPPIEKSKYMHNWWADAFDLLHQFDLTLDMVEDIARQDFMVLRNGALDFFNMLLKWHIPLDIVSAGLGDVIDGFLMHRGLLTPNVCVTANRLTFDGDGCVMGFEEPVIHSLNKQMDAGATGGHCVLLMGDTLEDAAVVSDQDCEAVIRVGFLNAETQIHRDAYLSVYDVVVDGDLRYVHDLTWRIIGC